MNTAALKKKIYESRIIPSPELVQGHHPLVSDKDTTGRHRCLVGLGQDPQARPDRGHRVARLLFAAPVARDLKRGLASSVRRASCPGLRSPSRPQRICGRSLEMHADAVVPGQRSSLLTT